ncbi:hypothetical protein BT67DRAFT_252989 [Trichocladium antarcticum]|uniref:Uncharacterized protein n=1 Tax=Trichocladium antarcticum TaxID=1450529 RepID=A0AAN6UBC7_9PEZI|nr:hypothetical protein BT67DRAFT_252989 [Trichocladium antarcticum]
MEETSIRHGTEAELDLTQGTLFLLQVLDRECRDCEWNPPRHRNRSNRGGGGVLETLWKQVAVETFPVLGSVSPSSTKISSLWPGRFCAKSFAMAGTPRGSSHFQDNLFSAHCNGTLAQEEGKIRDVGQKCKCRGCSLPLCQPPAHRATGLAGPSRPEKSPSIHLRLRPENRAASEQPRTEQRMHPQICVMLTSAAVLAACDTESMQEQNDTFNYQ